MAISLDAKTEVALSTNPQTIAHPTGTTNGDYLILVAATTGTASTIVPDGLAITKANWSYYFRGVSSTLTLLVAWKRFVTGDTAPAITTASVGYAAMYRYSGVDASFYTSQDHVAAATQDCPYVSGETGQEVLWIGAARRTAGADPVITLSRGSGETSGTNNRIHLVIYREALSGDIGQVRATMGQTNTPTSAGAQVLVLSDEAGHVYKGRDTAADDTTGEP